MELNFSSAWMLTVSLEAVVLFLLLRRDYPAPPIFLNAVFASTITLPFVWFVFPQLFGNYPLQIAVSELFAFVTEAVFYTFAFRNIGVRRAFFASFACNLVSFSIGLLLSMP